MSRTDKTRPFWVKVMDNPSRYKEEHDHRFGECNLATDDVGWKPRGCYYIYTMDFINSGEARCGCSLCSQSIWFFQQARKERRRQAREDREMTRVYRNADTEIDFDWHHTKKVW